MPLCGKTNKAMKRLTFLYCIVFCAYMACGCTVFGYANVYMLSRLFSLAEFGILTAAGGIAGSLMQPLTSSLIDRRYITLEHLIYILCMLNAVFFLCLTFLHSRSLITGIMYVAMVSVHWVLMPLMNSVSVYFCSHGILLDYGLPRGLGSGTYALFSILLGSLTTRLGESVIMVSGAVSILAVCMAVRGMFSGRNVMITEIHPYIVDKMQKKDKDSLSRNAGGFRFFEKYRLFTGVLGGITLSFLFHNMLASYTWQVVQTLDGSMTQMGFALALAAAAEIPAMVFYSNIRRRFSHRTLLVVSGVTFAVRAVAIAFVANIFVFYAACVLHIFSVGFLFPAGVGYTDEVIQEEDRFLGQAYFSVTDSLGGVLGGALGGGLITLCGIRAMLLFGAGAAICGAAMIIIFSKNK